MSLDRIAPRSYLALIYIISAVPASLWLPLKIGAVAIASLFALLEYRRHPRSFSLLEPANLAVIAYMVIMLGVMAVTLLTRDVPQFAALSASARYILVVALVYMGYLLFTWGKIAIPDILSSIFIGHFIYLAAKIATLLISRFLNLQAEEILLYSGAIIPRATDHGFGGQSDFVRVFLGNDAISPTILAMYFLYFFTRQVKEPRWGTAFITCICIGSILTYTRFVWASLLVVIVLNGILMYTRRRPVDYLRVLIISFATGLVVLYALGFFIYGWDAVIAATSERSGDLASLGEKWTQVRLSWAAFTDSPFMGTGVGSAIPDHLSTSDLPFQYEVQWMTLLMQLGIVGMIPMVLVFSMPLWPVIGCLKGGRYCFQLLFLSIVYAIWLAGSFTNPYLFILNSATVYLAVLMTAISVYDGQAQGQASD